jgi:hypothetical protein
MVIVEIEKSGDMTLGKWFSELRSWFDHNHCQPTLFNQSERVMGNGSSATGRTRRPNGSNDRRGRSPR